MKSELTTKQRMAIDALMKYPTIKEAAKASGTNERSLKRWKKQPEFLLALHDAQVEVHQAVVREVTWIQIEALEVIKDVMRNPDQPGASVKLKAATKILDLGTKLHEFTLIEERIRKLEEKEGCGV